MTNCPTCGGTGYTCQTNDFPGSDVYAHIASMHDCDDYRCKSCHSAKPEAKTEEVGKYIIGFDPAIHGKSAARLIISFVEENETVKAEFWEDADHAVGGYISRKDLVEKLVPFLAHERQAGMMEQWEKDQEAVEDADCNSESCMGLYTCRCKRHYVNALASVAPSAG